MGESRRPRISGITADALDDIKDENEYNTDDQAIRHALRKAGYDV